MPSKLEIYMERADAATPRLTEDYRIWTEFLVTAGRVYKYEFLEQAMIFAQRPDAIACAEYDLWKKRMRRYVWRGTTGIGLVSYSGSEPYVRFVFDVTDTGAKKGTLYPDWQYGRKHEPSVTAALESRFEVPGRDGIVKQLVRIAVQLAEERWDNYREDILSAAEGSFLEELDELNISLAFQRLAAASSAYTLMARCGLGPKKYFEPQDFRDIPNFNTVPVITQLGQTVSEACGQVLRRIEAVMKNPPAREPADRENAVRPQPKVQGNPKPQEAKAQENHIGQKSAPQRAWKNPPLFPFLLRRNSRSKLRLIRQATPCIWMAFCIKSTALACLTCICWTPPRRIRRSGLNQKSALPLYFFSNRPLAKIRNSDKMGG